MEYTNDVIFQVHYDKQGNVIRKWTSRIFNAIQRHKIITTTVIAGIVFIVIDIALLANFFTILSKC